MNRITREIGDLLQWVILEFPLDTINPAIDWIAKRWFPREWPDEGNHTIDEDPVNINIILREEYNFEGTYLSYHYEGQILDLRAPWGRDSHGNQMELHVRFRKVDDTVEWNAHLERSRYEHKEDHIREVGFQKDTGTEEFKKIAETIESNGMDGER